MCLLLECRLDPRQSLTDLVELPRIVRFGLGGEASPAALDQRGGDRRGDHGEQADPRQHHHRGDEPAGSPFWRDVPISHGGDRLQREPQTLADRRILLMVDQPLQDPARHRDHHRERGDDPRRPACGQRIMQHQARRQRNLPREICRSVLGNLSLAMLGPVRLRGSWLSHFVSRIYRDAARSRCLRSERLMRHFVRARLLLCLSTASGVSWWLYRPSHKLAMNLIAVMLGRNAYAAALVVTKLERPVTSIGGPPFACGMTKMLSGGFWVPISGSFDFG